MVGTTDSQVQRCAAASSQKRLALKRRGITTLPPLTSGPITVTISPLMW